MWPFSKNVTMKTTGDSYFYLQGDKLIGVWPLGEDNIVILKKYAGPHKGKVKLSMKGLRSKGEKLTSTEMKSGENEK